MTTTIRLVHKSSVVILVLFSLLIAACAPQSQIVSTEESHFSLAGLKLQREEFPTLVYTRPGAPGLEAYNRFIVDTVQIDYDDPNISELSHEDVTRMQNYFREAMIKELLDGGYVVGTRSEPGTLRISLAVTGLSASKSGGAQNLAGIAASAVIGVPGVFSISVGEVTVEGVFTDATQNRIDAVVINRSKGSRVFNSSPWSTWADVEASFDQWAEGFRKAVDTAHGKS
ncbi:MAG: DUF3313 domain-containing protein [Pikeienuella sp.]